MTHRFAVWALGLAIGLPATAQTFAETDTDGDGLVSIAEALRAKPDTTAATFSAFDPDNDYKLTAEQFEQFLTQPPPERVPTVARAEPPPPRRAAPARPPSRPPGGSGS